MENSNGEKVVLWDMSPASNAPMRRPRGSHQQGSSVQDVSNSTLSPNAKEFVPASKSSSAPAPRVSNSSAQNRLQQLRNAQVADVHQSHDHSNSQQMVISFDAKMDFEKLQHFIQVMTVDPGQFDQIVEDFLETIHYHVADETMISMLANCIVSHGLQEANFRYNGARLCAAIQEICPTFSNYCNIELDSSVLKPGLTLFLAELYTQVNYDGTYAKNLFKSIESLLEAGGDNNVKIVCQALKLCGMQLEAYNVNNMDAVLRKVQTLKNTVSDNIKSLVNSVNTLRENNWGQSSSYPTSSSSQNGCNWNWIPPAIEKPTLYGPDGMELSLEEQKFLAKECGEEIFFDDEDDPDELCDPEPEMDEEIQQAFRDFVKLGK